MQEANPSGVHPVDHKILVRPDSAEKKIGSIIIPETTQEREKYAVVKGTLTAAGPNAFSEWGEGNVVRPGFRVLIAQYAGAIIKGADGAEYRLMNDEDVIATLEAAE
jgi:chaperonin GroES